jgi:hypothetical protein
MNFKALTVEQMNRVSGGWLSPEQRSIVAKVPQLWGMKEDIEEAHADLVIYVPTVQLKSPALIENRAKATEGDGIHDHSVRAAIYLMLAAKELAKSPEEAIQLQSLIDDIYPDGFATTGKTYEEESGAAALLQKRLTDEKRAVLMSLTFRNTNALKIVDASITAGLLLGELETQKRHLEQELAESATPSASEVKRAQYNWIDMAKMVVKHTNRALNKKKLTQKEHDDFLESLVSALQVAERRLSKTELVPSNLPEEKKS